MTATGVDGERRALRHDACFYEGHQAYVDGISSFLDGAEAALVAVPETHADLLRGQLDGAPVQFVDMTQLGRNPGCIIPAIRAFLDDHRGRRVRFVGEPIWAGRTPAEIAAATQHEALINLAFADRDADVLCPYDVRGLDSQVLDDALRTHPTVLSPTGRRESGQYADPLAFVAAERWPLDPVPGTAAELAFDELGAIRPFVQRHADAAGLHPARIRQLQLAANEVCTNTLRHGAGRGTLRVWQAGTELICQVDDTGTVSDPLAGRWLPPATAESGRGLFIANHMCDLLELRSGPAGTTVRMHVRL